VDNLNAKCKMQNANTKYFEGFCCLHFDFSI
jgi:hypothetical protein